jgi:hypothetical protein
MRKTQEVETKGKCYSNRSDVSFHTCFLDREILFGPARTKRLSAANLRSAIL